MTRPLPDWRPWLAATVVLALALFRLDFQPLWADERATIAVATYPTERFLTRITVDEAYIGMYYTLMRAWSVLGTDAFAMRLPSVIFAVLCVLVVYALARRLFARPDVALAAALLTATNAFVIRYAQEARVHGLTALLVATGTLVLLLALERPSVRRWASYAVVGAAAVHAHLMAALIVPVHATVVAVRRQLNRRAAIAYGLMAALLAPLAVLTVLLRRPVDWIDEPTLRTLPRIANMLAGGPPDADRWPVHLAAFGAAALVGLAMGLRQHERWRFVLLLGWAAFPVLLALAASYLYQPMIVARYFLFSAPPLMILAGYGVMSLRPRWLGVAALVGLFVVAAHGLWWLYFEFEKEAFTPA